jgi:YidC/Oxa1 family membrane protein insertase
MENNRNYYLAIVLSVLIVFVWQFFYMGPKMQAQRTQEAAQQAELIKEQKAKLTQATPGTTTTTTSQLPSNTTASCNTNAGDRIAIDTPSLSGSINLSGGLIDDLKLMKYRETVEPKSANITLLHPCGTTDAYFVELGYTGSNEDALLTEQTSKWAAAPESKLTVSTPVTLTFKAKNGVEISRVISVDDNYLFTVTDTVKNAGTSPAEISPFGRIARDNIPTTPSTWVLHEGYVGVLGGSLKEGKFKDFGAEPVSYDNNTTGWFGITDKYWAAAIVPDQTQPFISRYFHDKDQYQAVYKSDAVTTLKAGESKTYTTRVFAGAKQVPIVDAYETKTGIPEFSKLIDWGWFYFLTKPMFKLMDFFYHYFGNFGLAILGTTVVVKTLFFPIANRQYASMAKMKKVQPKLEELKAKFGDDKMGLQTAMMQLYKEEKINPLAGCWPIFLQIPVFFSLYKVIYTTIEMRQAPFFGWIHDLSVPDPTTIFNLFGLLPFTPPHALMLGVWPIIMGITMFLQMRMNPTPPDPTQAMIFNWMPLVFTFMLGSFPAGLVIYWAWNNSLSVIQQAIIMKRNGAKIELFGNVAGVFKRKPSSA